MKRKTGERERLRKKTRESERLNKNIAESERLKKNGESERLKKKTGESERLILRKGLIVGSCTGSHASLCPGGPPESLLPDPNKTFLPQELKLVPPPPRKKIIF